MTARGHYWLLRHPRCGKPFVVLAGVHALALAAVWAAPRASAATNATVLNWTGLKDSYGVPIGDYYLAIASIPEQISQAGPSVTWDPASWAKWSLHAMAVIAANLTTAHILTAEAGFFIGIIAVALWIMKITVSSYWLAVVGELARAITGAVVHVTTGLGLLLAVIPVGVFTGVVTIRRGEAGRGAMTVLGALTMPMLSLALFADPVGEMYGPHGLLAFGRRVGFSVAQAARPGGALAGAGFTGQLESLTGSLITHTVREPLQLWNFGHVVDRVGGCGPAWSAAVRSGVSDAPIRAMGRCGDRAALAYAEHLDGTNIWVGTVFVAAALLLGAFMAASGWAVLKVSVQAIWTTAILLPALWLGAVPGAPRRRAMEVVWQFFRHGVEVTVYIVLVSVIGLAVEDIMSRPLPAELGGTNPFAHVLMMGAVCHAAFMLLRHVKADLSGRPGGRGLLGRAADVAVGAGNRAGVGGAGAAALGGLRGLRSRSGSHRPTPWEQIDAVASDAHEVLGAPRSGFEPVPTGLGGGTHAAPDAAATEIASVSSVSGPRTAVPAPGPPTPTAAAGAAGTSTGQGGRGQRRSGPGRPRRTNRAAAAAPTPPPLDEPRGSALPNTAAGAALWSGSQPASVDPITHPGTAADRDQIPPPPEPPPVDDEPPPDQQGPTTATVDPITGR
jgi:hypothetical protein